MLRSAPCFLSPGPLSPASAVPDYLMIIVIDIRCNVPNVTSTDERWGSHPISILISDKKLVNEWSKLKSASDRANKVMLVAAPDTLPQIDCSFRVSTPKCIHNVTCMCVVRIRDGRHVFTQDTTRVPPVFNYTRVWEWHSAVEAISQAFEDADHMARSERETVEVHITSSHFFDFHSVRTGWHSVDFCDTSIHID